jgi:hypothetical protein
MRGADEVKVALSLAPFATPCLLLRVTANHHESVVVCILDERIEYVD